MPEQAIELQQQRRNRYKELEQELKESGEKQISVSDADSRLLMLRNHISEVAYNVQSTVDAKHNLLIDDKVTNENDSAAPPQVSEGLFFAGINLFKSHKGHLHRIFVLMPPVDIHMKNIKYLLNTFIFGNKLRIPVGL